MRNWSPWKGRRREGGKKKKKKKGTPFSVSLPAHTHKGGQGVAFCHSYQWVIQIHKPMLRTSLSFHSSVSISARPPACNITDDFKIHVCTGTTSTRPGDFTDCTQGLFSFGIEQWDIARAPPYSVYNAVTISLFCQKDFMQGLDVVASTNRV